MANINYVSGIVKVLENPIQTIRSSNIPLTKFRVQFPQVRKNVIIDLVFWGNLGRDVANYYKINDYILINGYLSTRDKIISNSMDKNLKRVEITVLKIYPVFCKV